MARVTQTASQVTWRFTSSYSGPGFSCEIAYQQTEGMTNIAPTRNTNSKGLFAPMTMARNPLPTANRASSIFGGVRIQVPTHRAGRAAATLQAKKAANSDVADADLRTGAKSLLTARRAKSG